MRTISVSTSAQLMAALASAQGGDTISLAGGTYGKLAISKLSGFNIDFPSAVTIRSADPANPAVFTGMDVRQVNNLVIDGVTFDYTWKAGDNFFTLAPFQLLGATNTTIRNSLFDGDFVRGGAVTDDGFAAATGLFMRHGSGITLDNNEFRDFFRGISVLTVRDVRITGNDIHSMRSDGMNIVSVQNALVEGNHIHDFRGSLASGDHRDMIQVWTNGTTVPTTGLTIRGNTLDIGEGSWTQSIFIRNEEVDLGRAGYEMYYRDILIEDNVIYNAHLHGISTGETDGLVIRNNSLIQITADSTGMNPNQAVAIPRINLNAASRNVTVENNVTSAVNGTGQGWVVQDNALIQAWDQNRPGHYEDVFLTTSLDPEDGLHAYIALPGSQIDLLDAGAARMRFAETSATLSPMFNVTTSGSTGATVFDGSFTTAPTGRVGAAQARFIWDFGDGTAAEGITAQHAYAKAGTYQVTLHVVTRTGAVARFTDGVGIEGGRLVSLNSADGRFYEYGYGQSEVLGNAGQTIVTVAGAKALDLGGTGVRGAISRGAIDDLFGADNFSLSMRLQADEKATGWGEVARLHGSLIASVDQAGAFWFQLFRADGSFIRIKTAGVVLNDGRAHDVKVDYSSTEGKLKITVDGVLAGSGNFTGVLTGAGSHDLVFGYPWSNGKNFEGTLQAFDLGIRGAAHPSGAVTAPPSADAAVNALIADALADYGLSAPIPDADPVPRDLTGHALDLARLAGPDAWMLRGDAHLTGTGTDAAVRLDGVKDWVLVGRVKDYEASQKLAFSVDYARALADGSHDRIVMNNHKMALYVSKDGLVFEVATRTEGFKAFTVANLGLNDTDRHSILVMIDQAADRLQIVVDDAVVFDETSTDFSFVGAGGGEWGWMLSNPWNRDFHGDIHDFEVSDTFAFQHSDL